MSRENSILAERRRAAAARAREARARQKAAGWPDDRVVDASMTFAVSASVARVAFSDADRSTKEVIMRMTMIDHEQVIRDAIEWMVRKGHDRRMSNRALRARMADRAREWRNNWLAKELAARDA